MPDRKPILCLDFDGVIHQYTSGWQGAGIIPDPPVDGAMAFIVAAVDRFTVAVYSSRSNQPGGIPAMQGFLLNNLIEHFPPETKTIESLAVYGQIQWPTEKPPALVTLDDRAVTFTGTWPSLDELAAFKPWNKR